jgi:hypothetical protein
MLSPCAGQDWQADVNGNFNRWSRILRCDLCGLDHLAPALDLGNDKAAERFAWHNAGTVTREARSTGSLLAAEVRGTDHRDESLATRRGLW